MRKTLTSAAALLSIFSASGWTAPAGAVDAQSQAVQGAVDLIETNPKLAETRLKVLKSPTAKVYLAYLYMSHKVASPQAGQKIDNLMHAAAAQVGDPSGLGDVEPAKRYHYTDMAMFLKHLRFITDADGCRVQVPNALFKKYPAEAFAAYAPYWGSTRDSWLPITVNKSDDISQVPAVRTYLATLNKMMGDPNTGTIRYLWYRKQSLSEIEASLTPKLFITMASKPETKTNRNEIDNLLDTWSNEELWNKVMCKRLDAQMKAAVAPLAEHYRKRFNYTADEATKCAEAALQGIKLAYFDSHSNSLVEDRAGQIYDVFKGSGLSLAEMQKQLGETKLTKKQLPQALRMAILNDANLEVIEWLIKNEAPVSGGTEPPLFTAVMRADVVALLLKSGADVNEKNPVGKTALFQAVQFNAGETVKALLAAGADVNCAMTSVEKADEAGVNNTGDFNYTIGSRTPLMYAAAFGDVATVKSLLDKGADKKAADSKGKKPVDFVGWNEGKPKAEIDQLKDMLKL